MGKGEVSCLLSKQAMSLFKTGGTNISRRTQYIGLTRRAIDFLADYQQIKDSKNCTLGMFDEEIPLGEWISTHADTKFGYIKEVLQDSSWSNGPMIFTCLQGFFRNDPEHKNPITILQWILDPNQKHEFDREKGTYCWV